MTLRKITAIAASALALLAGSGAARADEVRLNDFSILGPSGISLTVADRPAANWTGAAGQFSGTWNGASFTTYCVEPEQYTSFGVTYSGYTPRSGESVWGAEKTEDLARLISYVGMSPKWSTDSAMVQAAVWEVVLEKGRDYSFTSGNAKVSGLDASTQDWLNALDWNAVRNTAISYDVSALVHENHQDLLVAAPVPEPSTYAMMIGGLALVGAMSRRRKRKM